MKPGFLLFIVVVLAACAPLRYTQLNQRQVRMIAGDNQKLHAAILTNAEQQGWMITEKSRDLVVALGAVESGGGMTTRDEWHFRIEVERVSAQLIPQVKTGKRWKSTDQVSEGYSYARENYQLDKISALVTGDEVQLHSSN